MNVIFNYLFIFVCCHGDQTATSIHKLSSFVISIFVSVSVEWTDNAGKHMQTCQHFPDVLSTHAACTRAAKTHQLLSSVFKAFLSSEIKGREIK